MKYSNQFYKHVDCNKKKYVLEIQTEADVMAVHEWPQGFDAQSHDNMTKC